MNEPEKNPSTPPEDAANTDPNSITQPRKRLRKLIAGSQENEAIMNQSGALPAPGSPEAADGADAADAVSADAVSADASNISETADATSAAASAPVAAQPPVDSGATLALPPENPPPAAGEPQGISGTQRHPTGDPQATGGWFGMEGTGPTTDQAQTRPFVPDQTRVVLPHKRALPDRSEPSSPPPPPYAPPPYGGDSTNLPHRVEETDPNATQVTPAAYQSRANITRPANRPAADAAPRPLSNRSLPHGW